MSVQVPDPRELPRLLLDAHGDRTMSLAQHLELRGELPNRDHAAIVEAVASAGLRGRGGAGFPTSEKMRAVIRSRSPVGGRPVVVVNASEGEPVSVKDRFLLESVPHLVLDGAALAAIAVGARRVIVALPDGADGARARKDIRSALAERAEYRPDRAELELAVVPDRFVTGEETALVNRLNGGPALPTFVPPRPFERGVHRRPTLINNAETLAHMALIARYGSRWFRALGTPEQPGSLLATVSGDVEQPGVWEIESGTPLRSLLGAPSKRAPRAVLVGGYFGCWIDGAVACEATLDNESLAPWGASLGAGAVVALGRQTCPVPEVARVLDYLAGESSGQCGPCVHGLTAIARSMNAIAYGNPGPGVLADLQRWAGDVTGRGACRHPDGAVRFLRSALHVFADELDDHVRNGPCDRCHAPAVLPVGPAAAELMAR